MDLNSENEINNEIENSKIKNILNIQNINNKQNKKEKEIISINWFQNQDNSYVYDSITTVFISSLKNYIDNQIYLINFQMKIAIYFLIIIEIL